MTSKHLMDSIFFEVSSIRPSRIPVTNMLVVDVATDHDRAYYPVGPWWLVFVVICGGEHGGKRPMDFFFTLRLLSSLSLRSSLSVVVLTPKLVRGFWWLIWNLSTMVVVNHHGEYN